MTTPTDFNFSSKYNFRLAAFNGTDANPQGIIQTQIAGIKGYAEGTQVAAEPLAMELAVSFQCPTTGTPLWNLAAIRLTDFNGTNSSGSWITYAESTSSDSVPAPPMYGITIGPESHIVQLRTIRGYFSVALDGLWFDLPLAGSRDSLTPSTTARYATPMQPYSKRRFNYSPNAVVLPNATGNAIGSAPSGPELMQTSSNTLLYKNSFSCTGGDFWTDFTWSEEEA